MSKDDTKSGLSAKVPGDLAREFTIDNRLGASIAKASPEAQAQISEHLKLSGQLLENSRNWQQENRADRVSAEKAKLLERYMNDPAPRPNDPAARQNDLRIIGEQAKKHAAARERFHQDNLRRDAKSYVHQILRNDREQARSHDHGEPERER